MAYIFKVKYYLARIILYLLVLPKRGIGMEVGVWRGTNAKLLYRFARPKYLFLVDPYLEGHRTEDEREGAYNRVKNWSDYKTNIQQCKYASENMSGIFGYSGFSPLDWIYIDGDHDDVYNDLTYWYLLVKQGGIIMGDDWTDHWANVKKDVVRFCKENNLKFRHLHCQWWITK